MSVEFETEAMDLAAMIALSREVGGRFVPSGVDAAHVDLIDGRSIVVQDGGYDLWNHSEDPAAFNTSKQQAVEWAAP